MKYSEFPIWSDARQGLKAKDGRSYEQASEIRGYKIHQSGTLLSRTVEPPFFLIKKKNALTRLNETNECWSLKLAKRAHTLTLMF